LNIEQQAEERAIVNKAEEVKKKMTKAEAAANARAAQKKYREEAGIVAKPKPQPTGKPRGRPKINK
jgi:hypothetical protein